MDEYVIQGETMVDIADAIREKNGETGPVPGSSMAAKIRGIKTGITPSGTLNIGLNGTHNVSQYEYAKVSITPKLQEKAVTPQATEQMVRPDSGYAGLSLVAVDAMPTAAQATPTISVSASGLIIASAKQEEGYVAAGTKSAMEQLTTQAAQTITPGTSNKTIASGRYLTGTQTIKGDSNLVAENIKKGVSIFGVNGSFEGGVTVQRTSGSVVTDGDGKATVNCGFKPDLVYLHLNEGKDDEIYSTAAAFNEEQRTGRMNLIFWSYSNGSMYVEDMYIEQTDSGFSFELEWNSADWASGAESNMTVYYAAVKYT